MRWILLINALAVVLLAGSVAIVLEGTRFGPPARAPGHGSPAEIAGLRATQSVEDEEGATAEPVVIDNVAAELSPKIGEQTDRVDDTPPTLPVPLTKPSTGGERAVTSEPEPEVQEAVVVEADTAPAPRQLRVVTEGAFPPFNYRNEAGQLDGFDVATIKEVCRRIDAICTLDALPWDDLQPALLSDSADIIAASLRIETVPGSGTSFSQPYYAVQGRFVGQRARAGNLLDMLNGNAGVAVQGGTIHAAYLRESFPSLVPLQVASLDEALAALKAGKVGLVFADNAASLEWLKEEACCITIGNPVAHPVLFGAGVGFAMRTVDESLKQDIDAAITAMKADGTLEQLSIAYVGGRIF